MEFLEAFLPILLYILGIVLMVVFIILGVKLIATVDRANAIMDDVEGKLQTLNGIFKAIDHVKHTTEFVTDRIINGVTSIVDKIFRRKKEEDFEDYE